MASESGLLEHGFGMMFYDFQTEPVYFIINRRYGDMVLFRGFINRNVSLQVLGFGITSCSVQVFGRIKRRFAVFLLWNFMPGNGSIDGIGLCIVPQACLSDIAPLAGLRFDAFGCRTLRFKRFIWPGDRFAAHFGGIE